MRSAPFVVILAFGSWTQLVIAQSPAWEKAMAEQRWTYAEPLLKLQLAQSESAPALRALATVYRVTGRLQEADPLLEKLAATEGDGREP